MGKIWVSSDFHYNHTNICYGVSKWTDKEKNCRKFNSLEEMNKTLVKNINKNVQYEDTLYFLGDWAFGGIESIWQLRKKIICPNIIFITGNHDQHIKNNKFLPNYDGDYNGPVNAMDIFSEVHNYLEVTINGQLFIMSHYPMEEWFEMDRKGSIMLHGHCHHTLDESFININYRRMDVGIDWREFRPYEISEIISKMEYRAFKKHSS